jgi:hypothetical protein
VNTKLTTLAACAAALLAFAPLRTAAQDEPAARDDPPKAAAPSKETPRHAGESQQDRMRHCAHEAKEKELKGEERRAFMSNCLRTH